MRKENLVFLDTETTGAGLEDRLCQVAYKFQGKESEALFKPPILIQFEAMAISHITNRMVEDKEAFVGSEMKKELENIFAKGNILVAHNALFDAEMLKKEGIEVSNMIDTLKIAQHLDEKAEWNKYNLQYLRYFFDLQVESATAHDALGDVRVLEKLFDNFFDKMMEDLGEEEKVLEKMLEISALPVLIKKIGFGKHNGKFVKDIAKNDAGYLKWLLGEKIKTKEEGGENDEDWIYTLEYYLGSH
ncbi:MAG: exonuclease domain-containing protein [Patescibacteria group bacterium]|jgi:exodeoxyribonuclease X|nr:exonuclease domain-containing protein [Patescibacteria group bacterium]